MFSFITTRDYATSNPRNFNTGFLIFPPGTSLEKPASPVRIGGGSPDQEVFSGPLLDTQFPLAQWRFSAKILATSFMGSFFGFNMQYMVSGATQSDGTGYLGISNDVIEGGMALGMSLNFSGTVRLEQAAGRDYRGNGWVKGWEDVVNKSFGPINVDVLQIAIAVLGQLLTGTRLPTRLANSVRSVGSVGGLYGFFGASRNQLRANSRAELRPKFHLSPNILEIIPEMRAVLKAFRTVGLRISMGPVLNFVFPIRFQVVQVKTDAGVYQTNGSYPSQAFLFQLEGGPTGSFPTTRSLEVVHSHTVSFEFTVDINIHLSFLGIFKLDESTPIGYDQKQFAVGIPNIAGPFFTALSGPGATASSLEIPEVEWG